MEQEYLQLLFVLYLAQDPRRMEQLRPALGFWREHEKSLTSLFQLLTGAQKTVPMPEVNKEIPPSAQEKRSPLQEIAGSEIAQLIQQYLQNDRP